MPKFAILKSNKDKKKDFESAEIFIFLIFFFLFSCFAMRKTKSKQIYVSRNKFGIVYIIKCITSSTP